jgi:hypothetical protein
MIRACHVEDVPPGEGRALTVAGRRIALFRAESGWYALDQVCPHAGGPLADGLLTRTELEHAVLKTAEPGEFDPNGWTYDPIVVPTTPVYYTQQGYGNANVASGSRAIDVILGAAPMPDRADVDAWIALVDGVRDTVYPPPTYP